MIALFKTTALGLFIMFSKIITGDIVSMNDFAIQTTAFFCLGFLLWKYRNEEVND